MQHDGIRAFWKWWETARHRVLKAIEVDRAFSDELVQDISQHVDAIDDLDWELGAGKSSRHAFYLSAKGDPELRLVTELWRSLGPAPDEVWEYHPARQPRPDVQIIYEGVELDPLLFRVAYEVDEHRRRVHGEYFHPEFHRLDDSRPALFLLLDGEFGEDGVERWLGGIEQVEAEPEDAVSFAEFREVVAKLMAAEPTGTILNMETPDGPLFVMADLGLKRIDHLLHTTHIAVDLAVLDQNPAGLPTQKDADELNALEDDLQAALGNGVVYFGRETRPGHRTMHWYSPDDSPAHAIVEGWCARHRARRAQATFERDPKWEFVKRY